MIKEPKERREERGREREGGRKGGRKEREGGRERGGRGREGEGVKEGVTIHLLSMLVRCHQWQLCVLE